MAVHINTNCTRELKQNSKKPFFFFFFHYFKFVFAAIEESCLPKSTVYCVENTIDKRYKRCIHGATNDSHQLKPFKTKLRQWVHK